MGDYPVYQESISKILTRNDLGETGGHQSGIHVPKDVHILSFFPQLGNKTKNPRVHLRFRDNSGTIWTFSFIYYNNLYFGGTRNEFRLTRMTSFIRLNDLQPGDELILSKGDDDERTVYFQRINEKPFFKDGTLNLGNNWKVIYTNSRRKNE